MDKITPGRIHVDFKEDGNADVKIENVNYLQLWGIARMLEAEANGQYTLARMSQGQQPGIAIARGLPPPKGD